MVIVIWYEAIGFTQCMHQSKIQLDASADAFKEDFGIDVASHTGLISMLLITDFADQIDCY